MSVISQINVDLVEAQKKRDEVVVSALRMLLAAVKNAEIAKGSELTDDEVLEQIAKSAKQHRESIDAYEKGGRGDLVEKEKAELGVISKFLPEQMNEEEIARIVDEVISATGAKGAGDLGRVMGQVMAKVKGKADGNVVSGVVRSKLG
ncbi:MAG: hypothetical protein UT84_C0002G0042 [Candidatus Curtissbacteria bacterium GW2011_GWA1_40_16]|uniref:GatB/YqeY domain-containing protein n=1 Tax=Candidatus Curtissbacteria bacterium GW2011_GWA1_40_16 TaxID=1618405 RepID=A0A0G0RMT6_9BACT|nr:MAG: hypothetical protein UT84_C0002G0042 [Candidatus Curtissbacteria bacterium GW2011_GWA1_40_16]